MKNASKCAKRFAELVKKLQPVDVPDLPDTEDPIAVLVLSFLVWESTTAKAVAAYRNIFDGVVDYNDLRVCMPHETMELIGVRYPRALDRCQRLRAVLRDIYAREHAVSLDRLNTLGKREVRKYIESLEGIVPYVAARLMLLSFQTHATPVDDQLRTNLIEYCDADASIENAELSSWLERQIKASDGQQVHYALQSWVDELASTGSATGTRKQSTRKKAKTSRKTTTGGRKTSKKLSNA